MAQTIIRLFKDDILSSFNLFHEIGSVVEIRIPKGSLTGSPRVTPVHGFFDSKDELFKELNRMSYWEGAYITLNPVKEALSGRAYNRLKYAETGMGASDKDIERLRWMLVDLDVIRPAGISSSDPEKARAEDKVPAIRATIAETLGISDVVIADSGNGYHILVPMDLPISESTFTKRFLEKLAMQFDDDFVKVDRGVFNPARITKLYGTLAAKGDSTPTRPHRLSRIIELPAGGDNV